MISVVIPSLRSSGLLNYGAIQCWMSTDPGPLKIVVSQSPGTFAENVNRGLLCAGDSSIIVIANNDARPLRGWRTWIGAAFQTPEVGIAAFTPGADCGWMFALRRLAVVRLDTQFVNSYDDYDLFARVADAGYQMAIPEHKFAEHGGSVSINKRYTDSQMFSQICLDNRKRFLEKWPGLPANRSVFENGQHKDAPKLMRERSCTKQ